VAVLEAILWAQPNLCLNHQSSLNEVLGANNAILKSIDPSDAPLAHAAAPTSKLALVRAKKEKERFKSSISKKKFLSPTDAHGTHTGGGTAEGGRDGGKGCGGDVHHAGC
jgi:hypothetical protein